MAGLSVAERLNSLNSRITAACARAGRLPATVKLLAVSKWQSPEKISDAIRAGQKAFAENYIQEAEKKISAFPDLQWHFIGRIQSNKAKLLTGKYFAIHGVDRVEIAELLNRGAAEINRDQNIFLQFNVAGEDSKGGVTSSELENLTRKISDFPRLRILGLMVMPPMVDNPESARPYFQEAHAMLTTLKGRGGRHPLNELSMGTSHDFEVAIEEGATWIRIGSEVFGPREEPT